MDKAFLVALKGGAVRKCGMTTAFVLFEVLYLSASDGQMTFIGCAFFCFWVKFVCDVRAWVAQLRYCSFYSRSVIVSCTAVGDAEQIFE